MQSELAAAVLCEIQILLPKKPCQRHDITQHEITPASHLVSDLHDKKNQQIYAVIISILFQFPSLNQIPACF